MRLNPNRLAWAGALVTAVAWTLCALLVAVAPGWTLGLAEGMLHADLEGIAWNLTWGGFFTGLVAWSVIAGLAGALLAWFYNHVGADLSTRSDRAAPT